ncbi:MAG: hypothetical protein IPJ76_09065 [Flavobacteriales bacterium]|nr:MAG: hypothetical protein IPJ76_09065 [Flavobacteriales bacterium]
MPIERPLGRDQPGAVAIQPDGKIIATAVHEYALDPDWEFVAQEHEIWRFLGDGQPDPAFGTLGRVVLPATLRVGRPDAIHVDDLGRILVGGSCAGVPIDLGDVYVARLMPDGQLDATFNGTGVAHATNTGNGWDTFGDMAVGPDGSIVVGGATRLLGGYRNSLLFKFDLNGTLDPMFGTGGVLAQSFSAGHDQISGVRVRNDGSIVVAGSYWIPQTNDGLFLRAFDTQGVQDVTFGELPGVTQITHATQGIVVNAVDLDPSGRPVTVSYLSITSQDLTAVERAVVHRFTVNGLIDATFGVDGAREIVFGAADRCRGMDLTAAIDGSIYAVATTSFGSGYGVAHLLADGTIDADFGSPSPAHIASIVPVDGARANISTQPDGHVVVLGGTPNPDSLWVSDIVLFRLDESFLSGVEDNSERLIGSIAYPVPITPETVLQVNREHSGATNLRFLDILGSDVLTPALYQTGLRREEQIGLPDLVSLPTGVYQLVVTSASAREVIHVLVQ